jgi:hypothetical protein
MAKLTSLSSVLQLAFGGIKAVLVGRGSAGRGEPTGTFHFRLTLMPTGELITLFTILQITTGTVLAVEMEKSRKDTLERQAINR